MNCIEHEDRNAVATCGQCGAGICQECEANTIFRINNKALCKRCNYAVACENDSLFQSELKTKQTAMIVNVVAFSVGLIAYFINGIGLLFLFWFIGGLVATIMLRSYMKRSKEQTTLLGKIAAIIGKLIGTALVCPVVIIVSLFRLNKLKKEIAKNNAILSQFGVDNNQQGDTNG